MTEHGGNIAINGGFTAIFSGIFVQTLGPLVNWLLVMTFIIIADLASGDAGFTYWDTILGKIIAWNGSAWVNLDGTVLS